MLILGSVLVLAQASAAAPGRPPSERPTNQCVTVAVSSPQAPKGRGAFSATQILDLQFNALLRSRIPGEHVLNLRVYTPKGHLYQQLDVPFRGQQTLPTGAADDRGTTAAEPRMRRVDGYPQPLPEQELSVTRVAGVRGYGVHARLPVAGTSIMTSSLYGKWKVVPHLDGSLRPCAVATPFSITQ